MLGRLSAIAFALFVGLAATPVEAREPEWILLGEQSVGFDVDRDTIRVGAEEGAFSRLRIDARGNDIYLYSIQVRFADGAEQRVNVDAMIPAGGRSAVLDLPGAKRSIRSVTLVYRARPGFQGRTAVSVYGEQESYAGDPRSGPGWGNPGPGGGPPRHDDERGPDARGTIATETYDRRSDRVTFSVPPQARSLKDISIRSRDDYVALESISVRFEDGETQRFDVYGRLSAGEESNILAIDNDRRRVLEVTVSKRPSWRPGQGTMELLGEVRRPSVGPFKPVAEAAYDRRADRITFRLEPRAGRLAQIRFQSEDFVTLENVLVRYHTGETQSFPLFDRLGPGEATQPVKLESERRLVTEVTVYKRPSWRFGQSRMTMLGLERPRPSLGIEPGPIPSGWLLFGAQSVGFGIDKDVIQVGPQVGQFGRIALKVYDNDIFLEEITVVYANGERDTKDINTMIPANSRTRAIELNGDRFIRQIELVYRSRPDIRSGRAVVEVYGEYARGWFTDRFRNFNRGWLMVATQRTVPFADESNAFELGQDMGKFRALQVVVRGQPVRILGMRVVYGNGETEEFAVLREVGDGQTLGPIDLKRNTRHIRKVEVRYRSKLAYGGGAGLVELWGLR